MYIYSLLYIIILGVFFCCWFGLCCFPVLIISILGHAGHTLRLPSSVLRMVKGNASSQSVYHRSYYLSSLPLSNNLSPDAICGNCSSSSKGSASCDSWFILLATKLMKGEGNPGEECVTREGKKPICGWVQQRGCSCIEYV